MEHPIAERLRFILIYAGLWILISMVHVATLMLLYKLPLDISIVDALVFNILFAIIALALWYPVRFNDPQKQSFFNLILTHFSIMAVTLALWISVGIYIGRFLLADNPLYLSYVKEGVPWRVFAGIFYYSTTIMIYFLFIYIGSLRDHIEQEAKLKNKVSEAELNSLKSQINPHFLFNSLNSISSLTLSDSRSAHNMIIKLSGFLRYSLAHDPSKLISLGQELENMDAYIDVEKIRFGDRLVFLKNIDEACKEAKVPFLILQPLIENAIKHGVYESTEPITIEVSCEKQANKTLKITVKNGYDPDAISQKGTGTGIKNIQDRLKIIYQLNNLLTFEKRSDAFVVELIIPLQSAI